MSIKNIQVIKRDITTKKIGPIIKFDTSFKKYNFAGDKKDYMVGNGNITFDFNSSINDVSFIIGSFGSIDADDGNSNDYVKITTSKGEIILQLQSFGSADSKIISNTTPYEVKIEEIAKYDQDLPGQDSQYGSIIRKIIISKLNEKSFTITTHADQDFSDEAFGYQLNSLSWNGNSSNDLTGLVTKKELLTELLPYRFNKIDNAFNQYGEVKIQVKFTAASKGLLLASADFENDEEEYLINTIMDFSSRSIKVTVPGLFYNYLVDENNVIQSFNFPGLTENTDYILELKYKTDSVNVKILDSSNKELFNREYLIGLLAYIGEEKLENTSFKFGVNTYSTDEAVSYFNFKDYLEEDFLYVGNRILDDDYLGVISLDNSVEFLTKQDYMKEAITMSLLNTPKFINKDSGITHYRYYLSKEKCPTNPSTTQPYPFIDLSFDTSKLKDDKGNYVLDHFYILVPFKFYEDNSYATNKYCYPIIQINSDRLSVPFNSKSFSGYMRVFVDLANKKITGEYLSLDSTINVSQLNAQWKTIKTVNLIEDKKTTIQFGLDAKYNHPYIYIRGIYFYKNNTNKYLVKSTFNMNLPMVDSATYPIQTEILSIQV